MISGNQTGPRDIFSILVLWTDPSIELSGWTSRIWEKFPYASLDLVCSAAPELPEEQRELFTNIYRAKQISPQRMKISVSNWRRISWQSYDAIIIIAPENADHQSLLKYCAVVRPVYLMTIDEKNAVGSKDVPPIPASRIFAPMFWIYTAVRSSCTVAFGLLMILAWLQSCFHRNPASPKS